MRRRNAPDGQFQMTPFRMMSLLALRADPAAGDPEIPKDLDTKVIDLIGRQAVERYQQGLPKVPETYKIKLPEKTVLPEAVLPNATALARKLGVVDDARAQELLDFVNSQVSALGESAVAQHKETVQKWEDIALNAPDLGRGDPKVFQAHVARVKKVLHKFFPEQARKLLDEHGIGSHPDFIRGLSKIADQAKEDVLEIGAPAGGSRSRAERIYPSKEK